MKNQNHTAHSAAGATALPLLTRSLISSLALSLVLSPVAAQAQSSPAPKTRFEYDAEGNPTKVVQGDGSLNLATQMAYDKLQRLIQQTDPTSAAIKFSYNGREDLTKVTDPRNLNTTYTLDGLAQRNQLQSPDTGRTTYTYDAAGNVITATDAGNVKVSYSYDTLNRLTQAKYEQLGTTTPPPPLVRSWTYDQSGVGFAHGVGRLTTSGFAAGTRQYAYDAQGRLTQATQALSLAGRSHSATTGYTYNTAGQLTQLTYPSGRVLSLTLEDGLPKALALTLTPGGTAQGLMQDIRWAAWSRVGGGAQVQGWNWNLSSGLKAHDRGFDEWGRLVSYPLGPYQRALGYDAADRITGYTHTQAGSPVAALDQAFTYDATARLTRAQVGAKIWTYTHDATGNRATHSTPTTASGTYTTATTSNRLTKVSAPALTLTHSSIGAVKTATWTATYNLAARTATLKKGTVTTAYEYDGDERRVAKSAGTAATSYVYGQGGELLGEYDMVTGQAIREYVWLGSTPVAMVAKALGSSTPELFLIHADHIDTPRIVTDNQGRTRWSWMAEPFGNELATEKPDTALAALTNPLRFPGQVFDAESGLHYNHHRYYDPRIGRYVQSDPIGLEGGINTYSYVGGNPVSYVDPEGLQALPKVTPPPTSPGIGPFPPPANDPVFGKKTGGNIFVTVGLASMFAGMEYYKACEEEKCSKHLQKIFNRMREIEARLRDLYQDKLNLKTWARTEPSPLLPPKAGSWNGHVKQLQGQQEGLKREINDALSAGCVVPPYAFQLAHLKSPPMFD